MPVITAYDSGDTPLEPDTWLSYRVLSAPATAPLSIGLSIRPTVPPVDTWNLLGWAMVEVNQQGQILLGPQTAVATAKPVEEAIQLIDVLEFKGTGARMNGFRGVHWNINRWVGTYRARVVFIT